MTALPADDGAEVHSMEDFLCDVLEKIETVDGFLHSARDQLRSRLRALTLMDDPERAERIREAEREHREGERQVDPPDFLEKRLADIKRRQQ